MKKCAVFMMMALIASAAGCKFFAGQQPREPGRVHRVTLTWDKVPRASDYNVYRRAYRGGEFAALGKAQGTTLEDPAATGGERYCYRVAALDAKGKEGAPSKEFCVTVPYP
jgi:fibronectin type 3 domain-containing protein